MLRNLEIGDSPTLTLFTSAEQLQPFAKAYQ